MTAKKSQPGKKELTSADPGGRSAAMKRVGGSQSDHWNQVLSVQAAQTLYIEDSSEEWRKHQYRAMVAGLAAIRPRDELEGMIAAQLFAAHNATMECYRRAMTGNQAFDWWRESLSQANKLSRTYAMLLDALNRHRGKGQQKVTVEHVHVHAGGQAVVGVVGAPGGGDRPKSEEQPHAKQIAHASQPTVWGADKRQESMPIAGNAERPLPNARRNVAGRTKGQQKCV